MPKRRATKAKPRTKRKTRTSPAATQRKASASVRRAATGSGPRLNPQRRKRAKPRAADRSAAPPFEAATAASSPDATSGLAQLLNAATPAESELLAILTARATAPLADAAELCGLAECDDEKRRLASLLDRVDELERQTQSNADAGQRHRDRTRRRQADISAATREIGPLPAIADRDRREACRYNFRLFCETYLAKWFYFEWSEEQLLVIQRIERAVLHGGLFAVAMPRGGGKTALCRAAVLWAVLFGHHHYVMLVCASDDKYHEESRAAIKTALETFPLLLDDFPEVCYPIHELEGINNRAKGQTLDGIPTRMSWKEKGRLILPTVPGSAASAAVIGGGGLKAGTIRGSNFTTPEGELRRPSLVIVDDAQTDESADSEKQSAKLERLISQAILGMAGPDGKISVLFPCTVIRRGDVADRLLDREKHPHWKGHRTAMLRRWPKLMELWEQYHELCRRTLKSDDDLLTSDEDPCPEGTAFVRANYAAMHEDAEVSWESRKRPYHASALQQAMDLYFRDRIAFFSEYQNWLMTPGSPTDPTTSEDLHVDADELAVKISGYERGTLPPDTQWVTAAIDCHDRVLYWMVCAWSPNFTGAIVDYGTFPETRRDTFYVGTFRPSLQEKFRGTGLEGALTAGLSALTDQLLDQRYRRSDGTTFVVEQCLVDTAYQADTVRRFIETSRHVPRIRSSFGKYINPDETPMSAYRQKPGERLGDNWLIRRPAKAAFKCQHVLFESNAWKTFGVRRLLGKRGDPGAVSIYGRDGARVDHRFLARQLVSEHGTPAEGRTKMIEWHKRPGETENHWFDNFIQNCVAASILGARIVGVEKQTAPKRRSLAELRANKRRVAA